MINPTQSIPSLFSSPDDMLNRQHPLYRLSRKINWQVSEEALLPLYSSGQGGPAKPIRLMCGLPIIKHQRNISDGSVVEQGSENACFQYFCGKHEFVHSFLATPPNPSISANG